MESMTKNGNFDQKSKFGRKILNFDQKSKF